MSAKVPETGAQISPQPENVESVTAHKNPSMTDEGRAFLAEWAGLDKPPVDFESHIVEALAEQNGLSDGVREAEIAEILDARGLSNLDPRALPNAGSLWGLPESFWATLPKGNAVKVSLSIWSAANTRFQDATTSELERLENSYDILSLPTIPLFHGTSYSALKDVIERGKIVSNRELERSGKDVLGGVGNTFAEDREFGLDGYVFADWGRPHTQRFIDQPEVTLVLKPDAMKVPGSFVTEYDMLDCDMGDGTISAAMYMSSYMLPDDFLGAVAHTMYMKGANFGKPYQNEWETRPPLLLADYLDGAMEDDSLSALTGRSPLNAWEVKIPEVDVSSIQRVVFRERTQFDEFTKEHPEIDCVYIPELRRYFPSYQTADPREGVELSAMLDRLHKKEEPLIEDPFGMKQAFTAHVAHIEQVQYAKVERAVRDDFEQRRAVIDQANPDEVREGVVMKFGADADPLALLRRPLRSEGLAVEGEQSGTFIQMIGGSDEAIKEYLLEWRWNDNEQRQLWRRGRPFPNYQIMVVKFVGTDINDGVIVSSTNGSTKDIPIIRYRESPVFPVQTHGPASAETAPDYPSSPTTPPRDDDGSGVVDPYVKLAASYGFDKGDEEVAAAIGDVVARYPIPEHGQRLLPDFTDEVAQDALVRRLEQIRQARADEKRAAEPRRQAATDYAPPLKMMQLPRD